MTTAATIAERLSLLLARKNLTHAELADSIGVSRQAVQFWCSGRSEPKGTNLARLADFFGVAPSWIKSGDVHSTPTTPVTVPPLIDEGEDVPPGYSAVNSFRLEFRASSSGGAQIAWEDAHDIERAIIRDEVFRKNHTCARKCRQVCVSGDSMEPSIFEGDRIVFIDDQDPRIVDGAVYAVSIGGDLKVKRLYRKADGSLVIHSDNPKYPDETIPKDDQSLLIHVFGRVIYREGSGGL